MGKRKFDTCFFERYAQISLETLLGRRYEDLINEDRPDLQMPDHSLGIEVTRAMEPRKDVANDLLKEMAGFDVPEEDREDMDTIIKSGYGYGLQDGRYIGHIEYDYWALAQPLRRIIESKVGKVGSGFYGDFKEYGLYIFCKDDLTEEEVILTMEYTSEPSAPPGHKIFHDVSVTYRQIVCLRSFRCGQDEEKTTCTSHEITRGMRRLFFMQAFTED